MVAGWNYMSIIEDDVVGQLVFSGHSSSDVETVSQREQLWEWFQHGVVLFCYYRVTAAQPGEKMSRDELDIAGQ